MPDDYITPLLVCPCSALCSEEPRKFSKCSHERERLGTEPHGGDLWGTWHYISRDKAILSVIMDFGRPWLLLCWNTDPRFFLTGNSCVLMLSFSNISSELCKILPLEIFNYCCRKRSVVVLLMSLSVLEKFMNDIPSSHYVYRCSVQIIRCNINIADADLHSKEGMTILNNKL